MALKAVYFVSTYSQRWGKGLTLEQAMLAAGLKSLKKPSKIQPKTLIYLAVFKPETTEDELENLRQCITCDQMSGTPAFYTDYMPGLNDPTAEADMEMISRLFLGWTDTAFL